MTVKQLIEKLQRNFAPEQEVFVSPLREMPKNFNAPARKVRAVTEDAVGVTREGDRVVGGLGPEACILWSE